MRKTGRNQEKVELWNILQERDVVTCDQVRLRVPMKQNADSPCTVIPREYADRLGLLYGGMVCVRYADGRVAMRRMARGLCLRVPGNGGRLITTDAVIEPKGEMVLLGSGEAKRMSSVALVRAAQ